MGHTRLGVLPATRRWSEIRELLTEEIDAGAVASATFAAVHQLFGDADRKDYGSLATDRAAIHAIWVLFTVPREARLSASPTEFRRRLAEADVRLPAAAYDSLLDFVAELTRHVRDIARSERFTSFSEVSVLALRQALTTQVGRKPLPLFDSAADDIREGLAGFGTNRGFASLATEFLASLLERTISFYVSRELPQHVGSEQPFLQFDDLEPFFRDLRVWCRERAEITDEFASTWLSRRRFSRLQAGHDERLSLNDARAFLSYALAKVGAEVSAHKPV